MACNVPVSGAGAPGANLADPCVCNAPIGSTYVDTVALTAYIKTGPGCTAGDWTNLSSCVCNFDLTDANANVESVTNGDTVTFLGQNGITITVSPTNTVTIDGLTTFGAVAPVAAPADTTQVNMYIDCTTSILYVWCPTSASWLATATAQTPLTVVDTNSIDLTASGTDNHTLQADVIIAPTQGGVDNSLSILATGLYVPDPTDYMVIDDLQDVDTTTVPPVAGDVLVWDGTNWAPVAQFTCEQVQDCLAASLPFATYNDATNDWTLGSVDFHSDVDTTTTVPVVGNVLSWDGTNWVPATSALSCEAVQDCLAASFPFATYNDATNDWTLGSVNSHSDVDTVTTAPVVGNVLSWDGTNWVPAASAISCEAVQDCLSTAFPFATYNDATNDWTLGSVDFHSDVDTTTTAPVAGDVLSWNGTNWVPTASILNCEAVQDCLSAAFPFATYNDATNDWTLGSINFHSDVDTVTNPPLTNQPLMWDGTNWTPIDAVCPATTQASVFLGLSSAGAYGWFNARQVLNYRSIAANGTLVPSTDGVIGIDASGGSRTFTLVAPAACDPKDFYIKRLDSTAANTITINGTIDGAASITLGTPGPFAATGGEAVHLMNIGGNTWIVV